jgi:hypothetical protein
MEEAVQNIKTAVPAQTCTLLRIIKMAVPGLTGIVGGKDCPTYEIFYHTGNIRAPVQSSGKGKLWQRNMKLLTARKSSVLQHLNTSSPCHHIHIPTSQICIQTAGPLTDLMN